MKHENQFSPAVALPNPALLQRHWYIRVGQEVYGPYDDQTLWAYVCEGRVTSQSALSLSPIANFHPAENYPDIAHWFLGATSVEPTEEHIALVLADIRSSQTPYFMHILQSLGQCQRLNEAVWIVRTTAKIDQLMDALSKAVMASDSLFVTDITDSDYAFANLGPAVEQRIELLMDRQGETAPIFG